ncbi:venom acid phosphatase Acph-1-like [Diorhabda sublineata]|uniref:venom acid phosphatase Acph-1-like n=1 Tax=Diorhabda sublineata TaxID=1163346 RepID=UPI0024E0CAFB|nr:venom acid phosphatase Acph-1-like [Diorhabda sublineata]
MSIFLNFIFFICFNEIYAFHQSYHRNRDEADSTVILTHVIFRHGNRTAELTESYPKDPYYNYTYFPIGRGQLTNAGKNKEYELGRDLRRRYNEFLGQVYYPKIVDAVSTNRNRTKASLQLVLAGLFPPVDQEVWNFLLPWQPVPQNYYPDDRDPVLMGINCPSYKKKYNELVATRKWREEFNNQKPIFDYISKNSGLNVTTYNDVYNLYFGLSTEEEFGQKLPRWTNYVWPKIVTDFAIKQYFVDTATTEMLALAEGFHLKKIIQDTKQIAKNNEKHGVKIYLYSAHENNVAEMQILLNIFEPHVPNYGSYLIFEVHRIRGVVGIKLYYNNRDNRGLRLMKIPSCDEFCPLDQFERIFEEYLPSSQDICYQ